MSKQFNATISALFREVYSGTMETYTLPPEKTPEELKREYYDLLSKHQDYRLVVQLFEDAAKKTLLEGLNTESVVRLQEALAKARDL